MTVSNQQAQGIPDWKQRAEAAQARILELEDVARPVLEFVSRGRQHVRQEWQTAPDALARRALGLLSEGGAQ